jgi:hypothetical protein
MEYTELLGNVFAHDGTYYRICKPVEVKLSRASNGDYYVSTDATLRLLAWGTSREEALRNIFEHFAEVFVRFATVPNDDAKVALANRLRGYVERLDRAPDEPVYDLG